MLWWLSQQNDAISAKRAHVSRRCKISLWKMILKLRDLITQSTRQHSKLPGGGTEFSVPSDFHVDSRVWLWLAVLRKDSAELTLPFHRIFTSFSSPPLSMPSHLHCSIDSSCVSAHASAIKSSQRISECLSREWVKLRAISQAGLASLKITHLQNSPKLILQTPRENDKGRRKIKEWEKTKKKNKRNQI